MNIIIYLKSLVYSIISIIILTIIITLFSYFNILNGWLLTLLKILIPISSVFIGGLILGKQSLNKGYIEGIKLGIIIIIILLLFNYLGLHSRFDFKMILYYIILIVSCMLGSMIGINQKISND